VNDIINTAALQQASVQDLILLVAWLMVTIAIVTQWDNFRRRHEENFFGRISRYVMNVATGIGWLLLIWKIFGGQEVPGLNELWAWLDTVKFKNPPSG
jgi:hypothetical protein